MKNLSVVILVLVLSSNVCFSQNSWNPKSILLSEKNFVLDVEVGSVKHLQDFTFILPASLQRINVDIVITYYPLSKKEDEALLSKNSKLFQVWFFVALTLESPNYQVPLKNGRPSEISDEGGVLLLHFIDTKTNQDIAKYRINLLK